MTRREVLAQVKRMGIREVYLLKRCCRNFELIDLVQVAGRKLLGIEVGAPKAEEKVPEKAVHEAQLGAVGS